MSSGFDQKNRNGTLVTYGSRLHLLSVLGHANQILEIGEFVRKKRIR